MKNNKEVKIPYWAAHLTTIVSVTLVLIIIGVIALASVSAANESRRLKEQIELNVIMADSVTNQKAAAVLEQIKKQPYVNSARLITKEEALKNWTADTGEDLQQLFGVNPLSPEISFTVKADYADQNNMNRISASIKAMPEVEGVGTPDSEMVESMNRNIENLTLILGGVALVLIVISFVLINNTVHLAIYSRRFTIHTMQLVGATNGFIRRPLILQNMLSGVIAGLVASGAIAACIAAAQEAGSVNLSALVSWEAAAVVFAGLIVTGALICMTAAWISASRYLHKDYDELFK